MTESTRAKLPSHLLQFVVDQNYDRYTPEDQATWRFVMRQLRDYLKDHAHPAYLDGLDQSGISPERIPRITDVDRHLEKFGWGAVPVSGFIPPAAFMEFQAIGVLPIASDVRSLEHWLYTPAPDIVHEAAGHAPLLTLPAYSRYLKRYGEIARHAILSREDLDQYEAIRSLSDVKEDPRATPAQIAAAEARLHEVNRGITYVSEAALLSRMNWWTAEYGLIGTLDAPKLFGAGLLSSVGEARTCLDADVKKIPLSVACVDYVYDITEPQPHLFVTPDFDTLIDVLDQFAARLSYRRGGRHGLDEAARAATVNTVVFDSGVQISGRLESYLVDDAGEPCYLEFGGPCQLATEYRELPGQGRARHAAGFSCPVGRLLGPRAHPADLTEDDLANLTRLDFASGVRVAGRIKHAEFQNGRLVYVTWTDCLVTRGDAVLFEPAWGEYDMPVGLRIPAVFGGPADRAAFGDVDAFVNQTVPPRTFTADETRRFALYADVRKLREEKIGDLDALVRRHGNEPADEWLIGVELSELAARAGREILALEKKLRPADRASSTTRLALNLGRHLRDR